MVARWRKVFETLVALFITGGCLPLVLVAWLIEGIQDGKDNNTTKSLWNLVLFIETVEVILVCYTFIFAGALVGDSLKVTFKDLFNKNKYEVEQQADYYTDDSNNLYVDSEYADQLKVAKDYLDSHSKATLENLRGFLVGRGYSDSCIDYIINKIGYESR